LLEKLTQAFNLLLCEQLALIGPAFDSCRGPQLDKAPAFLDDFQPLTVSHGGHGGRAGRNLLPEVKRRRAGKRDANRGSTGRFARHPGSAPSKTREHSRQLRIRITGLTATRKSHGLINTEQLSRSSRFPLKRRIALRNQPDFTGSKRCFIQCATSGEQNKELIACLLVSKDTGAGQCDSLNGE